MWKEDKERNLNLSGKTKHHVLEQKRKTQRETYANIMKQQPCDLHRIANY